MPDLPIIDTHVHLWDPTHFHMPWLKDVNQVLNRPYLLPDYKEYTSGLNIEAMVYLEVDLAPHYTYLEAKWVEERAQEDPRLQGMVVLAPLEYGEGARAMLKALSEIGPRVKGIRRIIQFEPDIDFCVQPDFVRGVQILPEYGFSFDICISHIQLSNSIKMVRQCPDTDFILDHIGKPDIKNGVMDPWRDGIKELASFPNVVCKVSGMVTEADHENWKPDDLKPYFEHVYESFGEDRVIFGGDWPVAVQASTYKRWVETLDSFTSGFSDEAKRKLWAGNARKFYRL